MLTIEIEEREPVALIDRQIAAEVHNDVQEAVKKVMEANGLVFNRSNCRFDRDGRSASIKVEFMIKPTLTKSKTKLTGEAARAGLARIGDTVWVQDGGECYPFTINKVARTNYYGKFEGESTGYKVPFRRVYVESELD